MTRAFILANGEPVTWLTLNDQVVRHGSAQRATKRWIAIGRDGIALDARDEGVWWERGWTDGEALKAALLLRESAP